MNRMQNEEIPLSTDSARVNLTTKSSGTLSEVEGLGAALG